ncbi:hypothetical protein Ptr902_11161 [Pyrenophora tritici-repentis]|nr:hypothetical protein Ptr902_11161 [Pyrenophora tritici-repentis]
MGSYAMEFDKQMFDLYTGIIENAWGLPLLEALGSDLLPNGERNIEKWNPEFLVALDNLSCYTTGDPKLALQEIKAAILVRTRGHPDTTAAMTIDDVKMATDMVKEKRLVEEHDEKSRLTTRESERKLDEWEAARSGAVLGHMPGSDDDGFWVDIEAEEKAYREFVQERGLGQADRAEGSESRGVSLPPRTPYTAGRAPAIRKLDKGKGRANALTSAADSITSLDNCKPDKGKGRANCLAAIADFDTALQKTMPPRAKRSYSTEIATGGNPNTIKRARKGQQTVSVTIQKYTKAPSVTGECETVPPSLPPPQTSQTSSQPAGSKPPEPEPTKKQTDKQHHPDTHSTSHTPAAPTAPSIFLLNQPISALPALAPISRTALPANASVQDRITAYKLEFEAVEHRGHAHLEMAKAYIENSKGRVCAARKAEIRREMFVLEVGNRKGDLGKGNE